MKKALVFLIIFFVAVSLGGFFYTKNLSKEEESNVSYDENAEYPDELRTDNTNEIENDDIDIEKLLEEDELTPDENFVDFEVEEIVQNEDQNDSEEIIEDTQEEPVGETIEKPVEEIPEEPVEDNMESIGKEIEVINSKVNIRREPNRGAKILTAVPIGTRGILLEEGDGWAKVQFGETVGYLGNKYWKFI